jgi:hypothetical protein
MFATFMALHRNRLLVICGYKKAKTLKFRQFKIYGGLYVRFKQGITVKNFT